LTPSNRPPIVPGLERGIRVARSDSLFLATMAAFGLAAVLLTGPLALAHPLEGWSPEARELIQGLVARKAAQATAGSPRPVAAIDCDNTLIDGDISFATLVTHAEARSGTGREDAGTVENRVATAYRTYDDLWESGRNVEACGYLAGLLEGMTLAEASALGRDALAKAEAMPRCVRSLAVPPGRPPLEMEQGIRLRKPMLALVDYLKAAGWEVFVVSASAEPVVAAVAARHGIDADHVLAVRTVVRDGRLTADVVPPVTWRQGKVDALRARIGRGTSLALGDAWTDFEMLVDAEAAVLIGRGKADLLAAARARGIVVQPRFEGADALPPCPQ
jgi:HAD superfamily phosphoserine phosphatase-like hydrolase